MHLICIGYVDGLRLFGRPLYYLSEFFAECTYDEILGFACPWYKIGFGLLENCGFPESLDIYERVAIGWRMRGG